MTQRNRWLAQAAAMVLGAAGMALAGPTAAQIGISVNIGAPPPPIPHFAQPVLPGPGYIWTPGYWAWDVGCDCYYWVPGMWVLPPRVGWLWTPGYWYWRNGGFVFSRGYWGPRVGFYGGVDYGHGYYGSGYQGGQWRGGQFVYNRSVSNIGRARVAGSYSQPVARPSGNRVSYNGGRGGTTARPTASEMTAARAPHVQATSAQAQRANSAASNPKLRANAVTKPGGAAAITAMEQGTPNQRRQTNRPVNPRNPAAPAMREPTTTMSPARGSETAPMHRQGGVGGPYGHGVSRRSEGMRQTPPETPSQPAPRTSPSQSAPQSRPEAPPPAPPPHRDMMPAHPNQPPAHSRTAPDQTKPDQSKRGPPT